MFCREKLKDEDRKSAKAYRSENEKLIQFDRTISMQRREMKALRHISVAEARGCRVIDSPKRGLSGNG